MLVKAKSLFFYYFKAQYSSVIRNTMLKDLRTSARSLSGHGQYRLCEQYQYLQVHPQEWVQMTSDQRRTVMKKFDDTPLRKSKIISRETLQCPVTVM